MADGGIPLAAAFLGQVSATIDREHCKELANLLFHIAEGRQTPQDRGRLQRTRRGLNDIARTAPTTVASPTLDFS
ncbi:MAG TPA: hypothetical protein VIW24_06990 [Aldersonia sp.]